MGYSYAEFVRQQLDIIYRMISEGANRDLILEMVEDIRKGSTAGQKREIKEIIHGLEA